jgi:LAO/AO transport system kinase
MTALVLPPGGGDGLQGIKRGVMELADCVVVNKADGEMATAAAATRAEYAGVLQLMRPRHVGWRAPALLASAASFPPRGLEELWECVGEFRDCLSQQHGAALGRREQRLAWLWGAVGELAVEAARGRPEATALAEAAASGQMSPTVAAAQIVHGVLEVSPVPMDID